MNMNYIYVALCFIPLVLYIIKLRNFELTVKKMVVIAMFSGLSFILSKIVFIQYPQGGSINLLSSLPILLIGLIYGPIEGMTTGLRIIWRIYNSPSTIILRFYNTTYDFRS